MEKLEFYIVDVFAESKYAGNQLAVLRNVRDLPTETMQMIARETNFAETTFIRSDELRSGGFDVRIFTPEAEIPFAGHPTLGTAFIIKEFVLEQNVANLTLNLKVGPIPVDFNYRGKTLDYLWMKQNNPTFGPTLTVREVAPILRIGEDEFDTRFPIQEVSTGIPFFIVPLPNLEVVKKIKVDNQSYDAFVERFNRDKGPGDAANVVSAGFLVFCSDSYEDANDLNARMFDAYYGVPEDPATGSANGCLLAYLLKHRYFGKTKLDLRVEQGYEIKRPSLLKIRGQLLGEDEMDIFVGGKVQLVAKGEWLV